MRFDYSTSTVLYFQVQFLNFVFGAFAQWYPERSTVPPPVFGIPLGTSSDATWTVEPLSMSNESQSSSVVRVTYLLNNTSTRRDENCPTLTQMSNSYHLLLASSSTVPLHLEWWGWVGRSVRHCASQAISYIA